LFSTLDKIETQAILIMTSYVINTHQLMRQVDHTAPSSEMHMTVNYCTISPRQTESISQQWTMQQLLQHING